LPGISYAADCHNNTRGVSLAAQEWGNPNGLEIVFIHGSHLAFFDWDSRG